tara:strand:- start:1324 stop:2877 length:1554 start_codon:yes stop_codon:yes gene_type:complete
MKSWTIIVYKNKKPLHKYPGIKAKDKADALKKAKVDLGKGEFSGAMYSAKVIEENMKKAIEFKNLIKEEVKSLFEKAVSKAQQQSAGLALDAKRGNVPVKALRGAAKKMYNSMTEKELEDFAGTKHKGLPSKKESVTEAKFSKDDRVRTTGGVDFGDEKFTVIHQKGNKVTVEDDEDEIIIFKASKLELAESVNEGRLNEAFWSKVYKAAKKGSYPVTIVVISNGMVVKQKLAKTPELVPAIFSELQKDYPTAILSIEDKTGKTLFSELVSKSVNEAKKVIKGKFDVRKVQKLIDKYGRNGGLSFRRKSDGKLYGVGSIFLDPKESDFAVDKDGYEDFIEYKDIDYVVIAESVNEADGKTWTLYINDKKIKSFKNNLDAIRAQIKITKNFDMRGLRYKSTKITVDESVNEEEGVKHYTKDGKEWTGPTHKMPDGTLMTQNPHNDDSEKLFHKEDLVDESVNEEKRFRSLHKHKAEDLLDRKKVKWDKLVPHPHGQGYSNKGDLVAYFDEKTKELVIL